MFKDLEHVMESLPIWKRNRRKIVSPIGNSMAYRPTFIADSYRESVLQRIIELTESTYTLYLSKQYLAAVITARSCQESIAVLNFINVKLVTFSRTKDLRHLVNTLERLTFGFSDDNEFPEKISIMNCIDSVDKTLGGQFRQHYNLLSEYAHPNYLGTFGSFGKPDYESLDIVISPNKDMIETMKKHVECTIVICFELLNIIQKECEDVFNTALETCKEMHNTGELVKQFYNKEL